MKLLMSIYPYPFLSVLCHFQPPERVFEKFIKYVGDAWIVGHNVQYDEKMINKALQTIRKKNPNAKVPTELTKDKIFCTMRAYKVKRDTEIFQKIYKGAPKWSLDACCESMGISNEERIKHGALIDSKLCGELLKVR